MRPAFLIAAMSVLFLSGCGEDELIGSFVGQEKVIKIQNLQDFDYLVRMTDSSGETISTLGTRAGDILYGSMGEEPFLLKPDPFFHTMELTLKDQSENLERTSDLGYDSLFHAFRDNRARRLTLKGE